jgi:hypothetical protein
LRNQTLTGDQKNEGEGSRTAACRYSKATEAFIESGKVDGSIDNSVEQLGETVEDAGGSVQDPPSELPFPAAAKGRLPAPFIFA